MEAGSKLGGLTWKQQLRARAYREFKLKTLIDQIQLETNQNIEWLETGKRQFSLKYSYYLCKLQDTRQRHLLECRQHEMFNLYAILRKQEDELHERVSEFMESTLDNNR